MELVPLRTPTEIAALVADIVERAVARDPATVLGLATGSTPLPSYQELVRRHRAGTGPAWDGVRTFNLDEYVGLPTGHDQTYLATIRRELTDALGIDPARVHGPDPTEEGLPTAGERYEAAIAADVPDLEMERLYHDGDFEGIARHVQQIMRGEDVQ